MEKIELSYYFGVILISLVVFALKITSRNEAIRLILALLAKLVPLFCMLYSGIRIFQYFNVI